MQKNYQVHDVQFRQVRFLPQNFAQAGTSNIDLDTEIMSNHTVTVHAEATD